MTDMTTEGIIGKMVLKTNPKTGKKKIVSISFDYNALRKMIDASFIKNK